MVQLFLGQGAEVNARDTNGLTPLMFASKPEIKQLLIDAGAKE